MEEMLENLSADADSGNAQETGKNDPRERSTIQFPYVGLDDAVEIATKIHFEAGSGSLSDDQLAPALSMSHRSSGYRTRISAARMFGVVDTTGGEHRLTELGKRIVDSSQERAAKADAFLNIELYNRVYEEHKGGSLPPAAALQREFVGFGVAQKQTAKARQVMERSADTAGFFEKGRDRLVRPTVRVDGEADKIQENGGEHGGNGNGGNGGGDNPFADLDPLILGLLQRMPKSGQPWPILERSRWLQTLAMNLSFIHSDDPSESISVGIRREKAEEGPA